MILSSNPAISEDYNSMSREELREKVVQQFNWAAERVAAAQYRAEACGHFEAASALHARYIVQAQRIPNTDDARQYLETQYETVEAALKPMDSEYPECSPEGESTARDLAEDSVLKLNKMLNAYTGNDM